MFVGGTEVPPIKADSAVGWDAAPKARVPPMGHVISLVGLAAGRLRPTLRSTCRLGDLLRGEAEKLEQFPRPARIRRSDPHRRR